MKWHVIHECDTDTGAPTEWSSQLPDGKFVWIDKLSDRQYGITMDIGGSNYLYISKSLPAAKRWASMNLAKVLSFRKKV